MSTLYSLCLDFVNKNFKWKIDTSILPVTVERDVLLNWFSCTEVLDLSEEELVSVLRACGSSWRELLPVDSKKFMMLMCLPNEVPHFAYERNHIVMDYYIMSTDNYTKRKNLCLECYIPSSPVTSPVAFPNQSINLPVTGFIIPCLTKAPETSLTKACPTSLSPSLPPETQWLS